MIALVDDPARDAVLRNWVEQLSGAEIADVKRISGGAFRTSCRIGLRRPDGSTDTLFLKIDLGSAPRTPFDLRREHDLLARLDGRARAPRAIGFHDGACAMAMECLAGEANYAALDEGTQRDRVERSFAEAMVEAHRVDVATLGLAHLPPGRSIGEAIHADLDLWEGLLIGGVPAPDPITLFAFAWCRERMPVDDRPAVLVQGDTGPGNFLFDSAGVTGVVDWEMTHLGHPLEDVGCVLARSLVQPMASAERLLKLYNEAAGSDWTRAELLYATILVMTRFSVPISLALESRHTGLDYGLTNGYFRLSQISLLLLIAAAEGILLDETVPAGGTRPTIGFEFAYLRAVLGDIVRPAIDDGYARYRLDGAIGLISYIEAVLAETQATARTDIPATIDTQRGLIAADGAALRTAMQHMLDEAQYRELLMQPMLGALFGRRVRI
ncbi:phosphotransferase family protein [Flavisphingomonas formosensis]|uniref:phosphotransferase family protein n=1 Tax=Flavisphingomonas formosensis TaxID=861534 RepID=UPI0012F74AD3|nr:phosphotransferase family protein [Sphingomonas formosensis]